MQVHAAVEQLLGPDDPVVEVVRDILDLIEVPSSGREFRAFQTGPDP